MAGNVGIGTTSPGYNLHVVGTTYSSSSMNSPAFNYTSDRKFKENISTIKNPIQKIMNLRGVDFRWTTNHAKDIGFIAQEVETILPELVSEHQTNSDSTFKSVKYGNIVAVVVEAVKELVREFRKENLEQDIRMSRLEAENKILRKSLCQLNPGLEICSEK
jgi:hypothetical protein